MKICISLWTIFLFFSLITLPPWSCCSVISSLTLPAGLSFKNANLMRSLPRSKGRHCLQDKVWTSSPGIRKALHKLVSAPLAALPMTTSGAPNPPPTQGLPHFERHQNLSRTLTLSPRSHMDPIQPEIDDTQVVLNTPCSHFTYSRTSKGSGLKRGS